MEADKPKDIRTYRDLIVWQKGKDLTDMRELAKEWDRISSGLLRSLKRRKAD